MTFYSLTFFHSSRNRDTALLRTSLHLAFGGGQARLKVSDISLDYFRPILNGHVLIIAFDRVDCGVEAAPQNPIVIPDDDLVVGYVSGVFPNLNSGALNLGRPGVPEGSCIEDYRNLHPSIMSPENGGQDFRPGELILLDQKLMARRINFAYHVIGQQVVAGKGRVKKDLGLGLRTGPHEHQKEARDN